MYLRAAVCALLCAAHAGAKVQQVHTALGWVESELTVAWVAHHKASDAHVLYGDSEANLTQRVVGDQRAFTKDALRKWYTHTANMTGLRTNTMYYYKVGDSEHGYSPVYSIMNRRQRAAGEPYRHIITGDMGASCAFSLCTACTKLSQTCDAEKCRKNTTVGLVSEVETADMFLHVGDFAYDLGSEDGYVGDHFMRNIEQIAARNVYMVSHGNHEDSAIHLAHYIERFRHMPVNSEPGYFTTENGRAANTMYFSWDHGLVHYVSMSTELFFGVHDDTTNQTSFMAWLKKDLARANTNRAAVPWVVVQGHRSVYCTATDCGTAEGAVGMRAVLEPVLFEYGVDFFINGHEHNYERTYPLYQNKSDRSYDKPRAPIYVVSGAAGSHELHDAFTTEQPEWSAFRSNSFSYSRVLVHNHTHVHWQQVQTDPTFFPLSDYGRVIDDWWVVQDRHGPFSAVDAPQTPATAPCRDNLCESHDHWEPLLGLPRAAGEKFTDTIARFRAQQGEEAWRAKLRGLMEAVRGALLVEWEDVHADGNSDSAWRFDKDFKWKGGSA